MKKVFLTLTMVALTFGMNAQTINDLDIKDIPAKYIRVVYENKILKPFTGNVYIDYGQISRTSEIKKGRLLDNKGVQVLFNGSMGVLNFLEQNGYVYVNQISKMVSGKNQNHILMLNTNYNNQ